MKSLLPIIIIVLTLTGAITYSLAKKAVPAKKETSRFGISANLLDSGTPQLKLDTKATPTPTTPHITPTVKPLASPTILITPSVASPTATPKAELPEIQEATTKGGDKIVVSKDKKVTTVTKTTICTPVYGMANTCTEHVVVDTGAQDSIFFNLAGISYIGGLVAFIKAKTLKKITEQSLI